MAISSASGFSIGSSDAIDDRLVLTKAQMKSANDNVFPDVYMCVCSDDGNIYTYNKSNEVDETTGKFRKFESGAANAVTTDTEQTITGTKHFSEIRGVGDENENIEVKALGEEGCGITLSGRGGSVAIGGQDISFNSAFRPTWDKKKLALEEEVVKKVDGNTPDSNGNVTSAFGNYTNDLSTENTTDTWVPVLNNSKMQHRVIPAILTKTVNGIYPDANGNIVIGKWELVYSELSASTPHLFQIPNFYNYDEFQIIVTWATSSTTNIEIAFSPTFSREFLQTYKNTYTTAYLCGNERYSLRTSSSLSTFGMYLRFNPDSTDPSQLRAFTYGSSSPFKVWVYAR